MLRSHATIASEADGGGVRRGLHSVPHADRLFVGLPSWQSIGTSRDGAVDLQHLQGLQEQGEIETDTGSPLFIAYSRSQ